MRVYLRRRQRTDRPFRATQGSARRPAAARRGWNRARLRAPRRHRFPRAQPGWTPTGGRRAGERRGGAGVGRRHGGRGCFALRKQGERGARRCQLPSSHSAGWLRLFPNAGGAQAERGAACTSYPPPRKRRPPPRARLSRTAAGHRLHAPRHVGACTTTRGRGKGARGPKRPGPSPFFRLPGLTGSRVDSPQPLAPTSPSPVLALMFSRKKWPLERCWRPKFWAILWHTVPLPEPGGPRMTARRSLEAIAFARSGAATRATWTTASEKPRELCFLCPCF